MTATNHALTGALIGLTVHQPVLALTLALVSHVVCDAIPHWGGADDSWLRSNTFRLYLLADATLCFGLVVVLFLSRDPAWLLASICAFVATSPDFLWIRKYIAARRNKAFRRTKLDRFLGDIQWFQRPIGLFVEIAWAVGSVTLLSAIL